MHNNSCSDAVGNASGDGSGRSKCVDQTLDGERPAVVSASAPIAIHGRKHETATRVGGMMMGDDDEDASSVMSDDHKPSPSSAVLGPSGSSQTNSNIGSLDLIHVASPRSSTTSHVSSTGHQGSSLLIADQRSCCASSASADNSTIANSVSIILNDGANFDAKPYEHSVSGHHIMLSEKGKIWKATRAGREAKFYERVSRLCSAAVPRIGGDPVSMVEGESDEAESAMLIDKFLPRYYGTRKVSKLRCGGEKGSSKATKADNQHVRVEQFPPAPPNVYDGPYDASAPHTARDVVQSFLVEKKQSPGTTPPGDVSVDLGKGLPRADDSFVDMIVLEDVCDQMKLPCVLDVKMGTRQYGVDAPPEKKRSKHAKMLKSTSASLGLRLAGLKMFDCERHTHVSKGKAECRYLAPLEVEETLFDFCQKSEEICGDFLSLLTDIRDAFQRQRSYRFFTSSLLLVYDAVDPHATARVVMVDFAYTYTAGELRRAEDEDRHLEHDVGYLKGLESLTLMLARNARLHQQQLE